MFKKYLRLTSGVPLFLDIVTTILSFFLTFPIHSLVLSVFNFGQEVHLSAYIFLLLHIVIIWLILLPIHNSTLNFRYTSFFNEIIRILKTTVWGLLILLMLLYSFRIDYVAHSFIGLFGMVNLICLLLEKYCFLFCLQYLRKKGYNRKSVLIVGDGENSKRFIDSIQKYSDWGLDIVGFIESNGNNNNNIIRGTKKLGRLEDLPDVLHNHFVEEVIFALPLGKLEKAKNSLKQCELEGVPIRIISDFFCDLVSHAEADVIHGLPIITHSTNNFGGKLIIKRFIDISISICGIILLSPLLLIIAVAIKLTSNGPVFYANNVIGLYKKIFTVYKFRTTELNDNQQVTKFGRFLRKFNLDELPILFSVLYGDMSFVGPRLQSANEIKQFESWHLKKLSVKPGITCLWKLVNKGKNDSLDDNIIMDIQYINHWSIWLDLKIILKSIPVLLSGKGAH